MTEENTYTSIKLLSWVVNWLAWSQAMHRKRALDHGIFVRFAPRRNTHLSRDFQFLVTLSHMVNIRYKAHTVSDIMKGDCKQISYRAFFKSSLRNHLSQWLTIKKYKLFNYCTRKSRVLRISPSSLKKRKASHAISSVCRDVVVSVCGRFELWTFRSVAFFSMWPFWLWSIRSMTVMVQCRKNIKFYL